MLHTAVLSEVQREHYQRSGWLAVPGLVDAAGSTGSAASPTSSSTRAAR